MLERLQKMGTSTFRDAQENQRLAEHVRPINELVDVLAREKSRRMPYLAPQYGGTSAEVLLILQDPGAMTDKSRKGSGFICAENEDPTATRLSICLECAGLEVNRVTAWNAYPWYLPEGQEKPLSSDLDEGAKTFPRLLALLPRLRFVFLMGSAAKDGWKRYLRQFPSNAECQYQVVRSLHTGSLGITNGSRQTADIGMHQVIGQFQDVVAILSSDSSAQSKLPIARPTDWPY